MPHTTLAPVAPPSNRPRGFALLAALALLAGAGCLALLVLTGAALWWYPQLPSLDKVTHYQPQQALQVYTSDEVEIAQFGAERRQVLPLAQIPQLMQDAVIAVEDTRFREHWGIDPIGVARALLSNVTGGRRQGASTITQQVARTFFLSTRKTAERKIKEAMLAVKIEQTLSKDSILELYMNQIYLGQRAYGFGAAAQIYFGKPLAKLSIAEVAMLAGLPQNPAFANPISNRERADRRQQIVLRRMLDVGVITPQEWEAAKAERLQVRSPLHATVHAEHVAEMARQAVVERFGEQAYSQGYKVYTSLVAADQQAAYQAVRRGVMAYDKRQPYRGPEENETLPTDPAQEDQAAALALKDYSDDEDLRVAIVLRASPQEVVAKLATGETVSVQGEGLRLAQSALSSKASATLAIRRGAIIRVTKTEKSTPKSSAPTWAISQWPDVQSALVALNSQTGRVRAMVGGFDFADQQFNHATQGWRQPGSSFKPFLYSAALEKGVMPNSLVNDGPLTLTSGGDTPLWNPQNSDGKFMGALTLRQALAQSRNLVSIRLAQHVGVNAAKDWAARFGFEAAKQPDNLTLALGAGSTTPMQLASAYAVLANGGYKVTPVLIERITDAQGKVLFEAPAVAPRTEEDRVVPERNVYLTNSLLQEVTRSGTAARAQEVLKRTDIYGKTGTTNDAVDAWFAGFQPGLVAVVWTGYDKPRSLGSHESGGGVSLPTWLDYMGKVLKGVPEATYPVPEGVVRMGDDWGYAQAPEGGFVSRLGLEPTPSAGTFPVTNGMQ